MSGARKAVAVRFGPAGSRAYDYWAAFPCEPGQEILVPTRNGQARVIVVEVKDESDSATREAIGPAPELSAGTPDGDS